MRRERTEYERMVDNVLLLSLWARAQECSPGREFIGGRLKLMKLAFLVAYDLYWKKIKGLNTRFFRYTYGPYSKMVSDSWDELLKREYLSEEEVFATTDKGRLFADAFTKEVLALPENQQIASVIDAVIRKYAAFDTDELLRVVYNMPSKTVGGSVPASTIEMTPFRCDFTDILEEEDSEVILQVPSGWETSLSLTFDDEARQSMGQSIRDIREGRIFSGWEALTADV